MNEIDPTPPGKKWLDTAIPILFIGTWIGVQAFVLPRYGIGV
ncbi:MAG TPA: hypothetical protein VHR72_02950 [Gemmataceae bacterium]|jgi:hypothetical protein|nr:hypothetical protein [Gemmataceae bacterium]